MKWATIPCAMLAGFCALSLVNTGAPAGKHEKGDKKGPHLSQTQVKQTLQYLEKKLEKRHFPALFKSEKTLGSYAKAAHVYAETVATSDTEYLAAFRRAMGLSLAPSAANKLHGTTVFGHTPSLEDRPEYAKNARDLINYGVKNPQKIKYIIDGVPDIEDEFPDCVAVGSPGAWC